MPTREFRFEFIRDVVFEQDAVEAKISKGYDHDRSEENIMVVFRAKDDGKFYAFEYSYNGNHGIYSCFENLTDNDVLALQEVEKKEVTTTTWVPVG